MGWVGEMGREDWKMGMISDCYQLQENQRKNDPLTVKTPPPALVPLLPDGCRAAGGGRTVSG